MGLFTQIEEEQKQGNVFEEATQIKPKPKIRDLTNAALNIAEESLPIAGSIAGGIGGAALGGMAASPTVLGIPAGVLAGGAAGAGVGATAGEALKQKIQTGTVNPMEAAKTGLGYAAAEAVGGPAGLLLGKAVIKPAGEALAKAFIPKNAIEAKALQAYKAGNSLIERVGKLLSTGKTAGPLTEAQTAFDKGLMGTEAMIGVQAKRGTQKLWNTIIGPALKQSPEKVEMGTFFKEAQEKIVKDNVDPTRQKALLNALESIKEDFGSIKNINMEQLQKYKEGWAKFVPEKAYKGENIAGALNDVRNELAGLAREKIYTKLGDNVKKAYLDYGNLLGLQELGQAATVRGLVPPGGSFTGLHSLFQLGAVPVGTFGGQTIYKVGQGVQFLGEPGARTVRDIIYGQIDKELNPGQTSPSESTPQPLTPPTEPAMQ